jgi:transposase
MRELLAEAPRWTAGKQRLTATQLWRMLKAEGHSVGVTLVKSFVSKWKRERAEVFVPLTYKPGDLGEVDFFEVYVDVKGVRQKAWMFLLRGMASKRDFAWLYPRQDQTCFLDGHVRAFEWLGAIYQRLLFDNLKPAVAKVLAGSERQLTARFAALANHYLFEPCFARPATGHDKGGVEARGKGIRWAHLVPIPAGESLEAISRMLMTRLDEEAAQKKDVEGRTVLDLFATEEAAMVPMPKWRFVPAEVLSVEATRSALVKVKGGHYSVWSQWAGMTLTAHVGVDSVEVRGAGLPHVVHRRVDFGHRSIDYRHYLPVLAKKPQALRQVADKLMPTMDARFQRAWAHLVDLHGPKQAARVMAQVLKAAVTEGQEVTAARLEQALQSGEALQLAVRPPALPEPPLNDEALPASLRHVDVATARAADFDELLGGAS